MTRIDRPVSLLGTIQRAGPARGGDHADPGGNARAGNDAGFAEPSRYSPRRLLLCHLPLDPDHRLLPLDHPCGDGAAMKGELRRNNRSVDQGR
jgi:hypothetical protein